MSDLQELERRILSELEWAGEENLPTIMNTVTQRTGDINEVVLVQAALDSLVRADLVRVAFERDRSTTDDRVPDEFAEMALDHYSSIRLRPFSKGDSLVVIADLRSHLKFRESDKHWTGIKKPWPEIITTDAGKTKGREILEVYGYQWWR
jgi:hypothetical protein